MAVNFYSTNPYVDPETGYYNYAHERYHKREMEMICEKKIREAMPKMVSQLVQEYTNKAIEQIVGILYYDIQTCVKMSMSDAGDIFYGEQASQYISDHIAKELQKIVDNMDWTIKL